MTNSLSVSASMGWAPHAIKTSPPVEHCHSEEKPVPRGREMYLRNLLENVEGTVTPSSPGPRQRANDQGRFAQMKYGCYGRIHQGMHGDCSPSPQHSRELRAAPSGLCALPSQGGEEGRADSGRRGARARDRSLLRPWRPPVRSSVLRRRDYCAAAAQGLPQGGTQPGCSETETRWGGGGHGH